MPILNTLLQEQRRQLVSEMTSIEDQLDRFKCLEPEHFEEHAELVTLWCVTDQKLICLNAQLITVLSETRS